MRCYISLYILLFCIYWVKYVIVDVLLINCVIDIRVIEIGNGLFLDVWGICKLRYIV